MISYIFLFPKYQENYKGSKKRLPRYVNRIQNVSKVLSPVVFVDAARFMVDNKLFTDVK